MGVAFVASAASIQIANTTHRGEAFKTPALPVKRSEQMASLNLCWRFVDGGIVVFRFISHLALLHSWENVTRKMRNTSRRMSAKTNGVQRVGNK